MRLIKTEHRDILYTLELTESEKECLSFLVKQGFNHHNWCELNCNRDTHHIDRTHFKGVDMTELLKFLRAL